jgi:hypothetical protein
MGSWRHHARGGISGTPQTSTGIHFRQRLIHRAGRHASDAGLWFKNARNAGFSGACQRLWHCLNILIRLKSGVCMMAEFFGTRGAKRKVFSGGGTQRDLGPNKSQSAICVDLPLEGSLGRLAFGFFSLVSCKITSPCFNMRQSQVAGRSL